MILILVFLLFSIKERIPSSRDLEPLLDIDRNEKKFIAFLKSHVPKLNVDDLKKFMPATINLDPFLRKIIKGLPCTSPIPQAFSQHSVIICCNIVHTKCQFYVMFKPIQSAWRYQ